MASATEKTRRFQAANTANVKASNRNVARGIWQMGRLHTRESWLCWCPAVWAACLAAGTREISLDLPTFCRVLFGIWSSVTITHVVFTTFNDIVDCELDAGVERCKTRPLPSGMISYREAVLAFILELPLTFAVVYYTLGQPGLITFTPIWALSAIYPFLKRHISFAQLFLGLIIGGAVFPGWVAVTNDLAGLERAFPLFAATMSWVIYFDLIYATQDRDDDAKVGVKSLALFLGDRAWVVLAGLGLLQVAFFAVTALKANLSWIFWVFGLGVWALNLPWHVLSLKLEDRRSGGRIFKRNIMLGLYMTGIAVAELITTRVYLSSLLHVAERGAEAGWGKS